MSYAYTISTQDINHTIEIKTQATAYNTVSVLNKIHHPVFEYFIEDGTEVKKGQLIAEFYEDTVQDIVEARERTIKEIKDRQKVESIAHTIQLNNLKNSLERLQGQLKHHEAYKNRLEQYPLQIDIQRAQNTLDLEKRRLTIQEFEYKQALKRFSQKIISKRALERQKMSLEEHKINHKHAQEMFDYASTGSSKTTLKIETLKIEKINIQISELTDRIEDQKKISDIKKNGLRQELKVAKKQLKKAEDELANVKLYAPKDGIIKYSPRLQRTLTEGRSVPKGTGIFEVFSSDNLIFEGSLNSNQINWVKEGDLCELKLHSNPTEILQANVISISRNSKDLANTSSAWSAQNNDSGIKLYQIQIKLLDTQKKIFPGSYASCKITSYLKNIPVIDIDYLFNDQGQFYVFTKSGRINVSGKLGNLFFILSNNKLLGKKLYLSDPIEKKEQEETKNSTEYLSGQTKPSSATLLSIPRLRHFWNQKLTWVIKEGTYVKKGDPIFKFESEAAKNRKRDIELRIDSSEADLEAKLKAYSKIKKEWDIKIRSSEIDKEIAELQLYLAKNAISFTQYMNSYKTYQISKLKHKFEEEQLKWYESKPEFQKTSDLKESERKAKEALINYEIAKLNFEVIAEGNKEVDIKKAKLAYDKAIINHKTVRIDAKYALKRESKKINSQRRQIRRETKNLADLNKNIEKTTVKAPHEGYVQLKAVWDGLRMGRPIPGLLVWPTQKIASIYNSSKLYIEVEVDERKYQDVSKGQTVQVKIPSSSQGNFSGIITKIKHHFTPRKRPDLNGSSIYGMVDQLGEQVFQVRVDIDLGEDTAVKPGSIAKVNLEKKVK